MLVQMLSAKVNLTCPALVLPGVSSCILLFEKIIPFLSGRNTLAPAAQKQKTQ